MEWSRKGGRTMTTEEMREHLSAKRDFTFIASTGAKVTVDCSLLRSMTPQEAKARQDHFQRVAQRIRLKYAAQLAGGGANGA